MPKTKYFNGTLYHKGFANSATSGQQLANQALRLWKKLDPIWKRKKINESDEMQILQRKI